MRVASALCVVAILLAAPSAFSQSCPPTVVTSFSVLPTTIVGDGYQTAHGNYTTNQSGQTTGITLANSPSFKCIPPSWPASGPNGERGCTPIWGNADMEFFGSVTSTTTYNMLVWVPIPYNPPSCPDPGMSASLTLTAPATSPPVPNHDTTDVVCDDGTCNSPQAGKPINLINGNTWITQRDYDLPGLAGGLELERTWNSGWPNMITWPGGPTMDLSGMFGHSWRSTYEERLQTLTGGITKYWQANGNAWFFTWDSINLVYVLTDPVTARGTLTYDSGTTQYTLTFKNGSKRIFNSAGQLIALKDRNGNQTTITLDGSNRITQVTDAASRSIYFDYLNGTFPNLATALRDSVGTVATYLYDASGRLTKVTYADNAAINYVYNASNLITDVKDTNNVLLETHTYDAQRRGTLSERDNNVEKVTIFYLSSPARVLVCNSFDRCQTYYSTKIGRHSFLGEATNAAECATCGTPKAVVNMYQPGTGNLMVSTPADMASTYYSYDSQANVTKTVQESTTPLQTLRRE